MKIHSNFNGKQNVCRQPQNGFLAAHSKIFSWRFGHIPWWNNMLGVIHQQPARFQQIQAIGPGQGLRNHRFEPWNGVVWARKKAVSGHRHPGLGNGKRIGAQTLQNKIRFRSGRASWKENWKIYRSTDGMGREDFSRSVLISCFLM